MSTTYKKQRSATKNIATGFATLFIIVGFCPKNASANPAVAVGDNLVSLKMSTLIDDSGKIEKRFSNYLTPVASESIILLEPFNVRSVLQQRRALSFRSERGATEMAQFPLALYCMFLVLLLPLFNLVSLLVAGSTAYLATNDIVSKAATQSSFNQALSSMANEAYTFQTNSLARFVKMSPQGGYTGCGNDLFVLATDMGGAGVQSSSADQSLTQEFDTTKYIYEMQVVSSYTVSPLVSMSSFPLLGDIPGIGQPVKLSFTACRPIEHPGGMQNPANSANDPGVTPFARTVSTAPGGVPPPNNAGGWRTPDIYQQIKAAGQTVVSDNVLLVHGVDPWVGSGINITPGESVWLDTTAVGTWSVTTGGDVMIDANGYAGISGRPQVSDFGSWSSSVPSLGSLVGSVGLPPDSYWAKPPTSHPQIFQVGDTLLNYNLLGTGQLYFQINDTPGMQSDDLGAQMVRIIVAR